MSIRTYFIIGLGFCLSAFLSCEKNAQIRVHQVKQSLVVEGKIESGEAPNVILTHSLPFSTSYDTSVIKDLFIHDAKITVTTKNRSIHLVEKKIDTIPGIPLYYYTPKRPERFKGIAGHTYHLSIKTNGKTLEATTSIPLFGFILDSIWWESAENNGVPDSTKVILMARIYDPPQRGNYARYFTQRNSEPFFPGISSVAEDNITNGKFFDLLIPKGIQRSREIDLENFGYFYRGDTITLKFCNIDQATYRFWQTWEYARSNTGNPFSTPTKVDGNIPGALGYWGGYQVQYKSIIIPK